MGPVPTALPESGLNGIRRAGACSIGVDFSGFGSLQAAQAATSFGPRRQPWEWETAPERAQPRKGWHRLERWPVAVAATSSCRP
jgi:hypothetical protein